MNQKMCRVLSTIFFQAGVFSVLLAVFIWWYLGSEDPANQAHAERFGIFVGLWAPTLLILSNRFDRFADKAEQLPGLQSEHHDNVEESE
tara:strand:- start:5086 stop:5352 length:267 start_codon:yes stop_codon:yes gene_type:complete